MPLQPRSSNCPRSINPLEAKAALGGVPAKVQALNETLPCQTDGLSVTLKFFHPCVSFFGDLSSPITCVRSNVMDL